MFESLQSRLSGVFDKLRGRGALTEADVLSAVTVNDGKVFFSINVDAAEARAWEAIRAETEAAVRAIPGVSAAMVVRARLGIIPWAPMTGATSA